ncbi:PBP1A family penicillin-binding protein [Bacillus sp. DNRA2]|uniref:transglycosylase domain-containing protein n=1 Tax=Bacillus sp. DNRA2 TaxID=2723053 RepID=UPI002006DDA9|nr:PBP1A family penicillin-binding protein [Bacillus sp. DNRA2]
MERRQQRRSFKQFLGLLKSKMVIKRILLAGLVIALSCILIVNIFIWTSDVTKLEEPAPQPTIIFDQNEAVASKIASSNIEGVPIEQIPNQMIHAVIATEDQQFYKHHGLNYLGIARAMTQNIFSGEIVAGGSTITQQLAKNAFLTNERTYTRKLKELILTKKIERTYSKNEIIERYLNQIYFGEGAWGIQRAAQTYFGKDASELTLNESAILAGLIKAPSVLSPFKNMEKAIERRNLVLSLMEKEGYITENEMGEAKRETIELVETEKDDYEGKYPYYIDHIIAEAIQKYGLTEKEILSGGLRIYTEMNPNIQTSLEQVYANGGMFPSSSPDQLIQSGAIFINPSTGGISALVGGRGEHVFRGFNRATHLKRQPGSTMKPLAVYTPALEAGYEVTDTLKDQPININGYQPTNFDKTYRGDVSMYKAVIDSLNVPPVWLLDKIGVNSGTNAVERFGIPLTASDHSPSLALGGMNEGVSPLVMAQAYSTFANNGERVEAHAIQRIEDAEGNVLAKWKERVVKVTDSKITQKMTYMLKGVVDEGTGTKAQVSGMDIAGKTGSTQLPFANSSGTKDHWFVGYTPEIVGAVWLGYDQTDDSHYLVGSSGATAPRIFKEVLSGANSEFSKKKFELDTVGKQISNELKKIEKQKKNENSQKQKQDMNHKENNDEKKKEKEMKKAEKQHGKGNGNGNGKEKRDKHKE